jgi:hypothetical protein
MFRNIVAVGLASSFAASSVPAQTPTFEVTSVKRSLEPDVQLGIRPIVGGRFAATITVEMLIRVAYGYPLALIDSQIVGLPVVDRDLNGSLLPHHATVFSIPKRCMKHLADGSRNAIRLERVGDVHSEREAVTGARKSEADGGFDIQPFRQP